ncbi:MAG: family 78 glycoside hydrolase catalytic domain [Bariatricus sp.]
MKVYDLKVLHRHEPVLDETPYFSWKLESEKKNVVQTQYHLAVFEKNEMVWDSGPRTESTQSFVLYEGAPLKSLTDYTWKLTVWNNYGEQASAESKFSTALLKESDWRAKWIKCSYQRHSENRFGLGDAHASVIFEKQFSLKKEVKSATLFATAIGIYQVQINGQKLDDRSFAPEFTPYSTRIFYQSYDAAHLLKRGDNSIRMHTADGWYFCAQTRQVIPDSKRLSEPAVLFQIHIVFQDGSKACIFSDGTEICYPGNVLWADLYQGERKDFRLGKASFQPQKVNVLPDFVSNLQVQPFAPVRAIQKFSPKRIFQNAEGETIVDFGQNICGRAQIALHNLKAGQEVVFSYFEILDENGCYTNTMFAPQEDSIVSDGKDRIYEAEFTFHGFRYLRIKGMKPPKREDITAVLLSTEKENAGSFACSDPRLNRLYENVRYSQRNNMLSIPTDCPTRERAGWTGDLLIYAKTALLNEDTTPFFTSWLRSVREDQTENGVVRITSPYMMLYEPGMRSAMKMFGDEYPTGVAGWSDAIVWVPYDMYQMTGNQQILRENFSAMNRWCQYIQRTAREKRGNVGIPDKYDRYLWNTGFHFGEWLVPSRPDDTGEPYGICKESSSYIAPFFGYATIRKMAEICRVLDEPKWEAEYSDLASKMKWAIQNGILRAEKYPPYLMGFYVLAFAFQLVPEEMKEEFHEKLVKLTHEHEDCLDTGFLATPFLLETLCRLGETDLAETVLFHTKRPSWLYEVEKGATTIWEAWDADEAAHTRRIVSFDHYAFGCVDQFLFEALAGITCDKPGFRHFRISPKITDRISWCSRSFLCEAGKIQVAWNCEKLTVQIPPNTKASVSWKGKKYEFGSGSYTIG